MFQHCLNRRIILIKIYFLTPIFIYPVLSVGLLLIDNTWQYSTYSYTDYTILTTPITSNIISNVTFHPASISSKVKRSIGCLRITSTRHHNTSFKTCYWIYLACILWTQPSATLRRWHNVLAHWFNSATDHSQKLSLYIVLTNFGGDSWTNFNEKLWPFLNRYFVSA